MEHQIIFESIFATIKVEADIGIELAIVDTRIMSQIGAPTTAIATTQIVAPACQWRARREVARLKTILGERARGASVAGGKTQVAAAVGGTTGRATRARGGRKS